MTHQYIVHQSARLIESRRGPDIRRKYVRARFSCLASDQNSLLMSAVYQPGDGPGLRVEVLHLCPIPEVVDRHFTLGVAENELAFPDLISGPPNTAS